MHAEQAKGMPAGIRIIDSFPNPTAVKYSKELWYKQHGNNIVIIDCHSTTIHFPDHWTPLSIKCAFGGKEYYHFGGKTLAVGDGKFLVLNQGAIYSSSIESERPVESFTVNFTPENILEVIGGHASLGKQMDDPFNPNIEQVEFVEKLYPHNERLFEPLLGIRKFIKENEKNGQAYLELLYATLENMIRLHTDTELEIDDFKAVRRQTKEEMYKRLTVAKDYIDSCFEEDISLHHLSRICFLNTHYMLRQFKKFYKITPHQYLTNRRLQEARVQLLNSNKSVADIVRAVGFIDTSSFSKLFKKHYGYPPEKFRNNIGK
jgi:AraC family transcriptional regulator